MHITSLHIDRFGLWSDLTLHGFSEGLNVIYGPNGSGKTTLVQFIRSVLYGYEDDIRHRYLPAGTLGAGGAVTIQGPFGRRTISRHDVGDAHGRLAIHAGDGVDLDRQQLQDLLAGVRPTMFDRAFLVGFDDQADIDRLIDGAVARGFDILGGDGDAEQLRVWREQLDAKRSALAGLPLAGGTPADGQERRRAVQQELAALETTARDQRMTNDRCRARLTQHIADLELQLETLQRDLSACDSELAGRTAARQAQEESLRDARCQREREAVERHERLAEIDVQIERWQSVLRDIESRSQRLRNEAGAAERIEASVVPDPRHFLRLLETRIDQLQDAVVTLQRYADSDTCQCREIRTTLAPALQAMRDDVYRLCNHLNLWEAETLHGRATGELGHLQRCEGELRESIQLLVRRRQTLWAAAAGEAAKPGVGRDRLHGELCRCHDHPAVLPPTVSDAAAVIDHEQLAALDAEIARLNERRRELQEDRDTVQSELRRAREELHGLPADELHRDIRERIETLQRELRRLDARLRDAEQRRELETAIAKLEADVRTLDAAVRHPLILREASAFLTRLTRGEWPHLIISRDRAVTVRTRNGERIAFHQLSTSGREQVYLSLCLALVAAHARENARLPLIINDTFLNVDTQAAQAAATLLRDFTARGHQVFLFTRHEHIAELFRAMSVPVRRLPSREAAAAAAPAEDPQLAAINRRLSEIAEETKAATERAVWNAEEFPGELTDRVRHKTLVAAPAPAAPAEVEADSECFLRDTSPIEDAPSIDAATAERLRKIGVLLVRDLLGIDAEDAAQRLRHAGITAAMIERWRAEALLVCRVPRLRPFDARVLVACGVTHAEQLALLDADQLRRRVEAFAATKTGQGLLRSGSEYELSRLNEWIHAARRRNRGRLMESVRAERDRPHRVRFRGDSGAAERGAPADRAHPAERPDRAERDHRADRRRPALANSPADADAAPVVLKMDQAHVENRFYLNMADPIVEAPAIGPRMAERLGAIGIMTVADFLKADPAALAERLGNRRLTANTLRLWQQQATLACCIPNLRGHDAQVLVACGVVRVDQLAQANAQQLWEKVEAFIQTGEGKRLLRSAKEPDLAEVTQWIAWAGQSRLLRAA